jgi:hypothetical protein
MLPWRPLGMLTFGLTIIFLFVRLHGDGYDFPVQVVKCDNTLDFPKPSQTFLEISGVYHNDYLEWPKEQDQDGSIPIHVPPSSHAAGGRGGGLKIGVGWNSQWHLGNKKIPATGASSGRLEEDSTQNTNRQPRYGQETDEDVYLESEQWIWMTNVWLEDGDSGSGKGRRMGRSTCRFQ